MVCDASDTGCHRQHRLCGPGACPAHRRATPHHGGDDQQLTPPDYDGAPRLPHTWLLGWSPRPAQSMICRPSRALAGAVLTMSARLMLVDRKDTLPHPTAATELRP